MRFLVLAIVGALLVAAGVSLVYLPAGLIAAGVEMIAAAYVGAYLHAHPTGPEVMRP